MEKGNVEWVVVNGNLAVIGDEAGEHWFLDLDAYGDSLPFSTPMSGPGSPGSTAALLSGAVWLGLAGNTHAVRCRATSLPQYVLDLVGSYHNSRRTVPNYLGAAKRFRELERADLATCLERHAKEEMGHERLALRDLQSLGLPASRLVENLVPDGVGPLCDLFDRLSAAPYPIGCIGYSYFFESSAAKRHKADVDAMQALCPSGVDASRFMRAHSALSSEVDHVRDMIAFIAGLPASDRIKIAEAVYDTAAVALSGMRPHPKSEGEMWAEVRGAAAQEVNLPMPSMHH